MVSLKAEQIEQFIDEGFVRIEQAFPVEVAAECRAILWKATGCDAGNAETWTQPVIRIDELALEPFIQASNTAALYHAYDQLVGKDNWLPKTSLGSFPIRFPGKELSADTGWHVDASFPGEDINNYLEWRINFYSKGRGLLMLFLFSDVSENDAPTVIKNGSHLNIAKILAPEGEKGLSFMELARQLNNMPKLQEHWPLVQREQFISVALLLCMPHSSISALLPNLWHSHLYLPNIISISPKQQRSFAL